MQILALIGSPRKGGNTDILADAILSSAQNSGHKTSKIHLYYETIRPCIDCRRCKQGAMNCVLKDGMQSLYRRLDAADAILFATPVYWYGPSGVMKNLVDRLRPYYANQRLKGKIALLAAPAAEGPGDADLLCEMMRRSCKYLGMEFAGQALGTAYEHGEILQDKNALEQAAALGLSLGKA